MDRNALIACLPLIAIVALHFVRLLFRSSLVPACVRITDPARSIYGEQDDDDK